MATLLRPYYAAFEELGEGSFDALPPWAKTLPLCWLRGVTFRDCTAILTEAQNASREELILFLTRIGKGAKLVIEGDPDQSDLPRSQRSRSPLAEMASLLGGVEGIGVVHLNASATVRHPLIASILARV